MNQIKVLAIRAQEGNPLAQAELRRELETQLIRIARRTIRLGTSRSGLEKKILSEAQKLSPTGWNGPPEIRERLSGPIARSLCETLVQGLVREASARQPIRDTVLN